MEVNEVFYYNEWRGVNKPEVCECFSRLSPKEVANLKPGEEIWYDDEPYHLNGKVYGYTRTTAPVNPSSTGPFFRCVDTKKLEALIKKYGDLLLCPVSKKEAKAFKQFSDAFSKSMN
ncbi:MAG: hypothetical protein NTW17_02640 [Candidatus Pacearchaeota archaeon]|nr:hypothetical protein [Candidatus Pacearchaeota archaeon]